MLAQQGPRDFVWIEVEMEWPMIPRGRGLTTTCQAARGRDTSNPPINHKERLTTSTNGDRDVLEEGRSHWEGGVCVLQFKSQSSKKIMSL
jgi:hypothetical protein